MSKHSHKYFSSQMPTDKAIWMDPILWTFQITGSKSFLISNTLQKCELKVLNQCAREICIYWRKNYSYLTIKDFNLKANWIGMVTLQFPPFKHRAGGIFCEIQICWGMKYQTYYCFLCMWQVTPIEEAFAESIYNLKAWYVVNQSAQSRLFSRKIT